MRKQTGFTIIELVVVIILLGILAATALPRFMDVTTEAHASVVLGVRGGLQSGVAMYHAQWVAEGQPTTDTQIGEYGDLRTNASGYPYGTVDNSGGTSTVTTSADCAAVFSNILQGGAPSITSVANLAGVDGSASDFTTHVTLSNCLYYYTAEKSATGDSVPTLTYNSASGQFSQANVTLL